PIKVCVTFQGKNRYFKTGLDATEQEYSQAISLKPKSSAKLLSENSHAELSRHRHICEQTIPFSFELFERNLNTDKHAELQSADVQVELKDAPTSNKREDIIEWFTTYAKELWELQQYNTSRSHTAAANALKKYFKR